MTFFHSSIFYVHYQAIFKLAYLNMVKHPSFGRIWFTTLFLFLHGLIIGLLVIGRLLDEVLFPRYRSYKVKDPVFIISNPRCGTTFLHRMLSKNTDEFVSPLMYHTILPCVTYIKLIQLIGNVDRRIGNPVYSVVKFMDKLFFDSWKDVHPTGFLQTEEDEGIFAMMGYTPALCLLSPFSHRLDYLNYLDELPEKTKAKLLNCYKSSIQRTFYAIGGDKTPLIKNVLSTGRIKSILEIFPDAKVIYPIRNPEQAVPSVISMFRLPWKLYSKDIEDNSPETKGFGAIFIDYYKYIFNVHQNMSQNKLAVVDFASLKTNPRKIVDELYDGLLSDYNPQKVYEYVTVQEKKKPYKSKHFYKLEDYGLSSEYIQSKLPDVMAHYGFIRKEKELKRA